jgi:hypothetical protein
MWLMDSDEIIDRDLEAHLKSAKYLNVSQPGVKNDTEHAQLLLFGVFRSSSNTSATHIPRYPSCLQLQTSISIVAASSF